MRSLPALLILLAVFFGFGAMDKQEKINKDLWLAHGQKVVDEMFATSPPIVVEEETFMKKGFFGKSVICPIDILEEFIVYVWDYDAEKLPRNRVLLRDKGNRLVYQNYEYRLGTEDDESNVCYFFDNIPDEIQGHLHDRKITLPTNNNGTVLVRQWRRYVTCHYKTNRTIEYLTREERFDTLEIKKRSYLQSRLFFYMHIQNQNQLWRKKNRENDELWRECLAEHPKEACVPKKPEPRKLEWYEDYNSIQFRHILFYGPMLFFSIIYTAFVMRCC